MEPSPEIQKKMEDFVKFPVSVAGAYAGTAIGYYLAAYTNSPMFGGAIGAAVSQTITSLADIFARQLSERESMRIGYTAAFAIEMDDQYQKQNKPLRGDGYFDERVDDRSSAAIIAEGVFLKAKNAFEEKKLRYMGYMIPTLARRKDVPPEVGIYLLNLAERFTYRQLCIVALLHRSARSQDKLKWWRGYYFPAPDSYVVLELRNLQDILEGNQNSEKAPQLSSVGYLLYELMRLDRLPQEDLDQTMNAFTVDL